MNYILKQKGCIRKLLTGYDFRPQDTNLSDGQQQQGVLG